MKSVASYKIQELVKTGNGQSESCSDNHIQEPVKESPHPEEQIYLRPPATYLVKCYRETK